MPDTFTNWLTFTPATQVGYRRAYIDLPAFSYTGLSWAGGSECVAQFNFSASQNFILLNRPTKPTNVNYGLCIRYRVGDTVYRYKLWTDTNFVLNDDVAPLYNGQIIKKNFVLEVWNLNGQTTASQTTAIRMISSVRSVPTDITVSSDYALATGTEFTNLSSATPSLPISPIYRWTMTGSWSLPWVDTIAGIPLNLIANAPSYGAPDTTWLKGHLHFNGSNEHGLSGTLPSRSWSAATFYIVASASAGASLLRTVLQLTNYFWVRAGLTDKFRVAGWGSGSNDMTIPDGDPHIYAFSLLDLGSGSAALTCYIDDTYAGAALITPPSISGALAIEIGSQVAASSGGSLVIGEVVIFGQMIPFAPMGTPSFETDTAIKRYLRWYHFGEMPLPLTFDSGGAWLDNV